jgi:hypothetical protein
MRRDWLDRRFLGGIVIGLLATVAVGAIGIAVTVRIPVALYTAPITYTDVSAPPTTPLCPGDVVSFRATIRFAQPALVQTYTSIRDARTGRNVLGTQIAVGVRPQPAPIEIADTLSFTVPPELPAGKYEHIRATVALNMDAQPAFLIVPFTVRACP